MRALLLHERFNLKETSDPLMIYDIPIPTPDKHQVLIRVRACGVCHTELDIIEGRTPPPEYPIILGHQVVGVIEGLGDGVKQVRVGERVGVGWIYSACGECKYCREGKTNLCNSFVATGRDAHGGFADYMLAHSDFIFPIPETFSDTEAAPMLCAGAVGYRSLMLASINDGNSIGFTGFGASAHIVLQLSKFLYPNSRLYVFARNPQEREFALSLGAYWAGDTTDKAPEKLSAIIDTTPAWKPVVEALSNLDKNGKLIINAIRKEEEDKDYLMKLDYSTHLWLEKQIKTVANIAHTDIPQFLDLAVRCNLKIEVQEYPLEKANQAIMDIKNSKIRGAKVLVVSKP